MLVIYTANFQNAKKIVEAFQRAGLDTQYAHYFYGCVSGASGRT